MPPKGARTGGGSKTQPPKTMAKASTSSSSKSSGSSKTSSSSSVKKSTPPPAKPKNVDKVDFGKPKPQTDAGVYHKPRMIAAATGRDPEPSKPSKAEIEHKKKVESEAHKQIAAEKKVEANRNKINAGPEMVLTAAAIATSSVPPVAAAFGVGAVALQGHNAARQDKNEYTLAEKVAYDNYLYPKHQGYMSYDDLQRKNFAKENQAEIDQVKKEIKKEEEEEDQGS